MEPASACVVAPSVLTPSSTPRLIPGGLTQSENVSHLAPGTQFQPRPAPAVGLAFAVYSQEQVHLGHFTVGGRWDLETPGALSNSIPPQVPQGQDGVLGLPSQWRDLSGLESPSLPPSHALPLPEALGFRHPPPPLPTSC